MGLSVNDGKGLPEGESATRSDTGEAGVIGTVAISLGTEDR